MIVESCRDEPVGDIVEELQRSCPVDNDQVIIALSHELGGLLGILITFRAQQRRRLLQIRSSHR